MSSPAKKRVCVSNWAERSVVNDALQMKKARRKAYSHEYYLAHRKKRHEEYLLHRKEKHEKYIANRKSKLQYQRDYLSRIVLETEEQDSTLFCTADQLLEFRNAKKIVPFNDVCNRTDMFQREMDKVSQSLVCVVCDAIHSHGIQKYHVFELPVAAMQLILAPSALTEYSSEQLKYYEISELNDCFDVFRG